MEALNLPQEYPNCLDNEVVATVHEQSSNPLPIPSEDVTFKFISGCELCWGNSVTLWYQIAPALLALSELWFRLFAFLIAPIVIWFLIYHLIERKRKKANKLTRKNEVVISIISIVGMCSSMILLTDSLYVATFGRQYSLVIFIMMAILSVSISIKLTLYRIHTSSALCVIIFITFYLLLYSNGGPKQYDYPGIDLPTIDVGLHYSKTNPLMASVAKLWPEQSRTYSIQNGATPYLPTGDSLTGIPFLVNSVPDHMYHRIWVTNPIDFEAIALDVSFPLDGVHSNKHPIYLILHGLNGGSHEEYVKEFVMRRTKEGCTCIVMIARGLSDTPVRGWNVFHGARVTDVDTAAHAIQKGVSSSQLLAGVGFSMGAIVLSNYVARSGKDCNLDVAFAISGGLDMRENLNFMRSMRLWQPMLAKGLRDDFIVNKFNEKFKKRLTKDQYLQLMRATSISEIDRHAIVTYNGFDSLTHYYTEMSAVGNSTAFQKDGEVDKTKVGRIANISIPFCVLHALDDPLVTWRTMTHSPKNLVNSGSGYLMILLSKTGGHVGWPLGLNPSKNGWKWMNNAARDFVNAVNSVKNETS